MQSNGCNLKFINNLFKSTYNNDLIKNYDNRTIKSKETYKTIKYIDLSNIRNYDKKSINKGLIQLNKEKKLDSNDEKIKKDLSKIIKVKEKFNNKGKNNNNNINNNDIIRKKKKLQIFMIKDKNDKNIENVKIINNLDKKNPNKSIKNVETSLVQIEEQNKKERKKQ